MADQMRLVLKKPDDVFSGGATPTQGTKLYTPDGSKVTGVQSVKIDIGSNDIVLTTIVLMNVKIEYES